MRFCSFVICLSLLLGTMGCRTTGSQGGLDTGPNSPSFQKKLAQAQRGNATAEYAIGKYYSAGRNGEQDRVEAIKWLHKAAEKNNSKAQTDLGLLYLRGGGTNTDLPGAVHLFERAASLGNIDAKAFLVGLSYMQVPFLTNQYTDPVKLLRGYAAQGSPMAQGWLGALYHQGHGVPKDDARSVQWFRKAAKQGMVFAQASLGNAYFNGEGVNTNYAEAFQWFRNAAELGQPNAQQALGLCYQEGKGVRRDPVEAVKWFRKAAEQGDEEALISLGLAYRDGTGTSQDLVQAYQCLDQAAAIGNPKAVSGREELVRTMTPGQLAQAGVAPRRYLTKFDRKIIDAHEQRYAMSCIPSSVEMVLKLLGRVPASYYEQQDAWKNKADGSFHNFDGKTIEGVTFYQKFTQAHGTQFPLEELFAAIDSELEAGRYVIIGLPAGGDTHDWVIYDEDAKGEFLAVSKGGAPTIENNHVRKTITDMKGTDIGVYKLKP
jgi:TPR repeat protein